MRDTNQPFALSLSKGEHFFGCHPREGGSNPCRHPGEGRGPGFKGYRALGARSQNLIAVPRTADGFLSLLVQRKKPKKARPGWRDLSRYASGSAGKPTALLAGIGARLTRRAHAPGARRSAARPLGGMEVHRTSMNTPPHPRAQTRGSLLPIPVAMLERAIRGFENTSPALLGAEFVTKLLS